MKNLKVGVRLGFGFGAVLLLIAMTVLRLIRLQEGAVVTDRKININYKNQHLAAK
ncbi:hypothetical protein GTP38_02860 [Duganella sp. FT94W]|uniref:Uncharacterized protein n=1 Tax=Duganella lactea TaxID=2692173 RepID=A0ABW9V3B5_9BURK|nr:hypothetical protein [Duganella lactea]MYM33280.1 hypothetical protein [Duganella lactea]